MPERLVFQHTVEGLFAAFKGAVDPSLRSSLKQAGLDLDHIPQAVPAPIYGAAFELLREKLHPGVDPKKAGEEMGMRFLDAYFATVMGNVVRMLMRFMSVEAIFERASQNLASGANFFHARSRSLGPRLWEVWLNDYSTSPWFLAGVMRRTLELAGAKSVEIKLVMQQDRELTYHCSWA